MRTLAKYVAALAVVVALLVAGLYAGLGVWANHEFTECFAVYKTKDAAERAADAGRDVGFDASVERRSGWMVVFTFGETGADARDDRAKFRQFLAKSRGTSGHGAEGCIERGPLIT